VLFTEPVRASPLPHLLAQRPTSQTGILSSSSALSGIMGHKVPRDTDTPRRYLIHWILTDNSDRLRSLDIR
jgi:hypothetical protein